MVFGVLVLVAGAGLVAASLVGHRRAQRQTMDELLNLTPHSSSDADGDEAEEGLVGLAERAADMAGHFVEQMDHRRALGPALERARIPLRPGEYVIVAASSGLGVAALLLAVTGSFLVALLGPVTAVVVATQIVRRRIRKRRQGVREPAPRLPQPIASSLAAGHTFLRAIQMMCEESGPPMSEEFGRIVAETRLGTR